jgi:isochorismate hydrolase
VEDAMTSLSAEAHAFSIKTIFPRIGRIRSTADVLAGLSP